MKFLFCYCKISCKFSLGNFSVKHSFANKEMHCCSKDPGWMFVWYFTELRVEWFWKYSFTHISSYISSRVSLSLEKCKSPGEQRWGDFMPNQGMDCEFKYKPKSVWMCDFSEVHNGACNLGYVFMCCS